MPPVDGDGQTGAHPPIPAYPYDGSAIVYWDSGNAPPPTTITPPRDGEDPREKPRRQPAARAQKSAFLCTGVRSSNLRRRPVPGPVAPLAD